VSPFDPFYSDEEWRISGAEAVLWRQRMSGLKPGPISGARTNAGILRSAQNDKRKTEADSYGMTNQETGAAAIAAGCRFRVGIWGLRGG